MSIFDLNLHLFIFIMKFHSDFFFPIIVNPFKMLKVVVRKYFQDTFKTKKEKNLRIPKKVYRFFRT